MVELPQLQVRAGCQSCPLHEAAKAIGIPTRPSHSHPPSGKPKALLIVAGSPGVEEDKTGIALIGNAGHFAEQVFVSHSRLYEVADVFLTNAVRCFPGNVTVAKKHLDACSQWLIEDLSSLREKYSEVVLLLAGAEAMRQVTGSGLKAFTQGQRLEFGGAEYRVFGTYNPGILLPKNDSSKITAIDSHTKIVYDYLRDGRINYSVEVLEAPHGDEFPDPPLDQIEVLSLDIETYGCLKGMPDQNVFHPLKSIAFDGVKREDLVATVALAWRVGESYSSKVYVMSDIKDRAVLRSILERATKRGVAILGLNLQFDLQFLRVFDWSFRQSLQYPTPVIDLSVVNFLHCDQRPERGLKQMSALFGVYNYSEEKVSLKRGEKYEHDRDPDLWRYNCIDALATLVLYDAFSSDLERRYGLHTDKWKTYSRQWFNKLVWLGIEMSENGLGYDREKLTELHETAHRLQDEALSQARVAGVTIAGPGSEKSMVEFLERIVELYMPQDREQQESFIKRLEYTDKKKRISIGAENVNLLRGVVPTGHLARQVLDWYTRLKDNQKISGTYTQPILYGKIEKEGKPAKPARYSKVDGRLLKEAQPAVPDELSFDSTLIGMLCHPQWYVVPTFENAGNEGGTQQGRVTSKSPATQTQPLKVKECYKSRFGPRGAIVSVDGSQLEYRIAAALSGDPSMIETFAKDISYHGMTGALCKGETTPVTKADKLWYHAGKTINFLTMFLGTWMKLQETLLRDVGVHLSKSRCQAIIAAFDKRHSVFRAWQSRQIADARSTGFTELPLTGISRTFLGYVDETYGPTIVNFPVQTTAATCTLSAQMALWDWLRANGLRSLLVANTYDAIVLDCPEDEAELVARECQRLMRNPPIYETLIELGKLHRVKLDAEATITYNDGTVTEF